MRLTSLRLHDFRSYENVLLTPPEGVTVFVGPNGAGKTNLLEAVHLCCVGRSHRTSFDRELIRHGQATAAVQARVERLDGAHEVGVRLFAQQKRAKVLHINGKNAARMGELMGHVTCVMFSPEDLLIIKEGPSLRRRLLDMRLSQLSPAYFYTLQQYQAVLAQRNAQLRALQRGGDESLLAVWDEQLARLCVPVLRARAGLCERLAPLAAAHYRAISGRENETFALAYRGAFAHSAAPEQDVLRALALARADDIRRAATSVGPHRDDVLMTLAGRDLKSYGSQGQIRTAALAVKLAELDIMRNEQGEPPLLLLDDVLSELDAARKRRLLEGLAGVQTFITCTESEELAGASAGAVLHVRDGRLYEG